MKQYQISMQRLYPDIDIIVIFSNIDDHESIC